jgi:hypothetical protein
MIRTACALVRRESVTKPAASLRERRIECGSCAKEYDKESAGVNHEFAQIRVNANSGKSASVPVSF